MTRALLIACAVAAGCSSADPCDGQSGTCVSATVDGTPAMLDQLRVTVAGNPQSMLSPTAPSPFTLPVRVAIVLSNPPGASAGITIDGLVGGAEVSSSGEQMVPLTANGKSSYTFNLSPMTGGDGGNGDGHGGDGHFDMEPDLIAPPNVVSVLPGSYTFPATPRGTLNTSFGTIVVTNNTSHDVSAGGGDMKIATIGDMNAFQFQSATNCNVSNNGIVVPANTACNLVFGFQPDASGPLEQDITLDWSDGEVSTLTLKGTGTPVFSDESPNGSGVSFKAVWASSPTDWWAVGTSSGSACAVWRSTGNGTWSDACAGLGITAGMIPNAYSVNGTSPTDVWVGAFNGIVFHWDGNHFGGTTFGTNNLPGVIAFATNNAYAIDTTGEVYCIASTPSNTCSTIPQIASGTPGTPFAATGLSGANGWVFAVGPSKNFWEHQLDSNGNNISGWNSYTYAGLNINDPSLSFNAVWVAPNAAFDFFAVGSVVLNSVQQAAIFHSNMNVAPDSETPGQAQGAMFAVAGRLLPDGVTLDIWAGGDFGAQEVHTDGKGTWNGVQTNGPQSTTTHGIWVASDGSVVAVGDNGMIVHYY